MGERKSVSAQVSHNMSAMILCCNSDQFRHFLYFLVVSFHLVVGRFLFPQGT